MNMLETPGFGFTILAFLLVLGPLVFVHEYGHYIVGRWCGVKAEAFSIGFGPELLAWVDKRESLGVFPELLRTPSNAIPGVATCTHCLINRKTVCACGKFWQVVPNCFQIKAGASIRKISTPVLA